MKLIRLYSDTTDGLISNDLYSDAIQLKPYSEISLYNASISLSYNNIIVDNENRTFQFSTTSAPQFKKNVVLDVGDYTADTFITHVERKMNALIENNALGNGVQWVVSKTTDNLLKLQFSKPNNQSTSANLVPLTNLVNLNNVGGVYNKTAGNDYEGYGYSDLHFTRGAGHVITTLSNNLNSFICGLIDNKPDNTQTLDHTYYSYAIKYDHVLDKYYTIINGVETDTGLGYNVDEPLRITKNSGAITFYKNNISIGTSSFNDEKPYYLGFSIKNTDANTIGTLQMSPDNNESVFLTGEDYYNLGAQPSTVGLYFTIYSKALFGMTFDSKVITGTEGVFNATHSFLSSNSPTSIIVECVNLNLNSYDFSQNKRKSILATIPILQEQADRLIYNNINPIFITINNEYPIALNTLTLRFLDARDNKQISVGANGIDATILIK
jgi:hypothetical protein